jgi:hypothetical protein
MPNTKRSLNVNQWWLKGGVDPRDCLAAFQPIGASGITQSLQNINGRGTNDAVIGTTPTFAKATGWTFDGSTTYLTVGSGAIKSGVPLSMICLFNPNGIATLYDLMHISHSTADSGFKLQAAGATTNDPVRALSELATTEVVATTTTGFEASKWCVGAAVFPTVALRRAYIISSKNKNAANKNNIYAESLDATLRDYSDGNYETTSNTPVDLDGTYIGSAYSGAGTALANAFAGKMGACAFYGIALSGSQVLDIGLALWELIQGDYR